nr:MAG TPA: holin [Caudoviricetes sp.]
MEQLQPILLTLIVFALNLLGKFLKEWKTFPTELIPQLLGVLGGLIGWVVFKDTNAVLLGLASVGTHQVVKQSRNEDIKDITKTEDK